MKKKYIIGAVIALLFVVVAIFSFDSSKVEYADFAKARTTGKTFQVIGEWQKEKPCSYNNQNNTFSFFMKDDKNNEVHVIYSGSKPNNFDIANHIVVKGSYNGNYFDASDILTKCPSKYEATYKDTKKL
jgi:cytochrome c-type biogenesis protein CcmE